MSRVYVASSWRCPRQQEVVAALRAQGHDVFDFREHPVPCPPWGEMGYGPTWTADESLAALSDPRANVVYSRDMTALVEADTTVLVMPCGRSAHLELGFARGAGQRTAVLLADGFEPEIMQMMADFITGDLGALVRWTTTES